MFAGSDLRIALSRHTDTHHTHTQSHTHKTLLKLYTVTSFCMQSAHKTSSLKFDIMNKVNVSEDQEVFSRVCL